MFTNIKATIITLAKQAVEHSEKVLCNENGKEKKAEAIRYIMKNLPISNSLKIFLGIFLSSFIDSAIEISLHYIKKENTTA